MKDISILIIEDELIVAKNISVILEEAGYEVIGIANSFEEAIETFRNKTPHLIICDIAIKGDKNGVDTITHLSKKQVVPVIYLSAFSDKKTLDEALATNPVGYLVKPFTENQLLVSVRIALKKFYGDNIKKKINFEKPTPRELEIIQLIAKGLSTRQIAGQLSISEHTVNTHRRNILEKYDLEGAVDLINLAIRRNWIVI